MNTELISCGPNALGECETDDLAKKKPPYTKFLYWYRDDGWDGCGYGIGFRTDGLFDYWNLGHCSCFGPVSTETTPDPAERGLTALQAKERLATLSEDDYDYERKVALGEAFGTTEADEGGNEAAEDQG